METENPDFSIVTLHPGFILGPGISKIPSSSFQAIKDIMNNKYPGVPKFYFPCVDI